MKQGYKIYNWHSNKNTDSLVNRLARNMVILNQAYRVPSFDSDEIGLEGIDLSDQFHGDRNMNIRQ